MLTRQFLAISGTSLIHPYRHTPLSVVDHELKVRGIENLRIADASIMPTVTSGNTNAPSVMIGERIAGLVRARNMPRVPTPIATPFGQPLVNSD